MIGSSKVGATVENDENSSRWRHVLDRPIPALDGVRGVAIVAVLLHQLIIDHPDNDRLRTWWLVPLQAGWAGVELFFVLSGFLITGILLDTSNADNRWSSFFVRRALRILPPYYFLLAMTFWVAPLLFPLPADLLSQFGQQSWYWLHIANWSFLGGGKVDPLSPCWSLSVEEQFYLIWPFVVFTIGTRSLIRLCMAMIGLALVLRIGLVSTNVNPEIVYECTFTRVDALATGALAAIVVRSPVLLRPSLRHMARLVWTLLALFVIVALASGGFARTNHVTLTIGHTVLSICSACLVLVAVRDTARGIGRLRAVLSWTPLRLFGQRSYAIYLFHLPFHLAVYRLYLRRATEGMSITTYLCVQAGYYVIGCTFLLGIASVFHVLFERPILNLKRYFVARRNPEGEMEFSQ